MINVIEKENLSWKSAETKEFLISYVDWENKERSYFPDFLINGNKLVEIKPIKLWNTPKIKAKRIAAEKFCKDKNLIYEMVDCKKIPIQEFVELYISGKVILLDKYNKKFKEKYESYIMSRSSSIF